MLRRPSFVLSALCALILSPSSAATQNQEHESPLRFRVTLERARAERRVGPLAAVDDRRAAGDADDRDRPHPRLDLGRSDGGRAFAPAPRSNSIPI